MTLEIHTATKVLRFQYPPLKSVNTKDWRVNAKYREKQYEKNLAHFREYVAPQLSGDELCYIIFQSKLNDHEL